MSDQLSGKSAVSSSAAVCPPAQHADPATADKQQTSLQQLMERCEAADECDAINTAYATFLHRQPAQARWASQRESKLTQMKLSGDVAESQESPPPVPPPRLSAPGKMCACLRSTSEK